jgi:Phosphatase
MLSEYLLRARDALVATGVTGPHRSHTRRDTIGKLRALLDGDEEARFGLRDLDRYSLDQFDQVLGFLAAVTGCSDDPHAPGDEESFDPDLTVLAIATAARRLRDEARRGSTLLTLTGHPTGLLEHHIRVVDAYRGAGGKIIRLREEERFRLAGRNVEIRYVGGVGCLSAGASLVHTHSAAPMEAVLEAEPWPDLVLADHGFAGAAIARGIPTIAVMDVNDPALAIAPQQGRDVLLIPLDDNRPPRCYEAAWEIFERILGDAEA